MGVEWGGMGKETGDVVPAPGGARGEFFCLISPCPIPFGLPHERGQGTPLPALFVCVRCYGTGRDFCGQRWFCNGGSLALRRRDYY